MPNYEKNMSEKSENNSSEWDIVSKLADSSEENNTDETKSEYYNDEGMLCRSLDEMPFDKAFDVDNGEGGVNEELCQATGIEVFFGEKGDESNPSEWWNEYEDSNGGLHYGR